MTTSLRILTIALAALAPVTGFTDDHPFRFSPIRMKDRLFVLSVARFRVVVGNGPMQRELIETWNSRTC